MSLELHRILAFASAVAVALVGLKGAVRAWSQRTPDAFSSRATALALSLLGLTSAGGIGLMLRGPGPRQSLHLMYAALAIAAIPVASALVRERQPRVRGLAALFSASITLLMVMRLFATG